jgi:excisionase family DNA binding protein
MIKKNNNTVYKDLKKMLETLYDLVMEQTDDLKEIKQRIMALTSNSPKKIGLKGLAEIMGCSTTTAHKWLKTGIIPYIRYGNTFLFDETDVLEALRNRKSKRPSLKS